MKVVDFIKRLEEKGFNDKTELTFSCFDNDTDNWYNLKLEEDELAECIDTNGIHSIDVCVNVDNSDYLKYKIANKLVEIQKALNNYVLEKERR